MSRETQIVGFRVGRESYGIPIKALHEIVRVPEITAVPDAPDYLEAVSYTHLTLPTILRV